MMLPDELARNVVKAWGEAGQDWLDRLPALVAEIERRWAVQVSEPFDATYHYVVPAVHEDGTQVVLKFGVLDEEFSREVQALRHFGGDGAARLLKAENSVGAMMLERIEPGRNLSDVPDNERAASFAASVMSRFWKSPSSDHQFPDVSEYEGGLEWLQDQIDGPSPLPKPLLVRAEAMLRELLAERNEWVVLHGDLHHGNILSAEREPWLAIDPKGVVGDPAYELGPFFYNLAQSFDQPTRALARLIDKFAEELGFERRRIIHAVTPRAVLASWPKGHREIAWPDSDAEVWELPLACAQLLTEL